MAYDERLAERVLTILASQGDVEQKRMFGGISFLLRGNFCCGVVKEDLCVRVGLEAYDAALREPNAREMDFTGRPMKGWVFVAGPGLESEPVLREWVRRGAQYALSLPPK